MPRMLGRARVCGIGMVVAAVVALVTPGAHAEPSAAEKKRAAQLMSQGEAFEAGESLESALSTYRRADEIMRVPSTRVAVARVLVALGRLVHAREVAAQVMQMPVAPQEPTAFVRARSEAARMVGELDRRIPTLTVVVTVTDAVVTIDGVRVSGEETAMLDPGPHTVSASARRYHPVRQTVELAEGERKRISVELSQATEPAAKPPVHVPTHERETPSLAYVALGVGGLGIGTGAITGLMSISRAGQLKDDCGGSVCPVARKEELQDAKTLGWVSNVGFGVGLIGVGVGLLALSASRGQREGEGSRGRREVTTLIGPGQIGIRGRF